MRHRKISLIEAVQRCNLSQVRKLIACGADVNACDEDGHTALMYAAAKGRTGIVRLLLRQGAEIYIEAHSSDRVWKSAPTAAVVGGHLTVLRVLLQRNGTPAYLKWNLSWKARRDMWCKRGKRKGLPCRYWSSLSNISYLRFRAFVCAAGWKKPAALELLRPYADYGLHKHKTATNWFIDTVKNDDIEGAAFWLDLGVDIDATTTWGQGETALIAAAQNGNIEMVQLLMARGADVHATTDYGLSVFDALVPPGEHLAISFPSLYERLMNLQPVYEEIRRLLNEHITLTQTYRAKT